jgi:hypothetical protein
LAAAMVREAGVRTYYCSYHTSLLNVGVLVVTFHLRCAAS